MNQFDSTRRASVLSRTYSKKTEDRREDEAKNGLKGDYMNIIFLLILYILQGIPSGLMGTIPMIFAANNVPYKVQAIFYFASYPSAFKLLWAPIVDAVYSKRFGRRKTWFIPAQFAIGIAIISMAPFSLELIGDKNNSPKIYWLTVTTFFVVLLVATQEVTTDAWSLTLLSKRNAHYIVSTTEVGLSIGYFLTTTLFLSLESPKFCNDWLRSEPKDYGIVNIRQLFYAVGILFIVSATIIWIFKKEENAIHSGDEEETTGVLNTYKLLLKVIKLKSIRSFILIQMTHYVCYGVFMAAMGLKLIEYGVRREVLSLLGTPITIMSFFLPFIIAHFTKNKPLYHYWRFGFARISMQIIWLGFVYWTQSFNQSERGDFPWYFYTVFLILMIIAEIIGYTSMMSKWVFLTSVADPNFGGIYMTLFATVINVAIKWVVTLSLAILDPLTIKREKNIDCCFNGTTTTDLSTDEQKSITIFQEYNSTSNVTEVEQQYEVVVDGFYIQAAFSTIYAIFWFLCFKRLIWKIQEWPVSKWRILMIKNENVDDEKSVDVSLTNIKSS